MVKKLISMKFDETQLRRLDNYARSKGLTRTGLFEELAEALLEGRLSVLPRQVGDDVFLPVEPMPGSSPYFPVLVYLPEANDG